MSILLLLYIIDIVLCHRFYRKYDIIIIITTDNTILNG